MTATSSVGFVSLRANRAARGAAPWSGPAPVAGWGRSFLALALAVLYPFHTYVANVNVSAGDGVVALIGLILVLRLAAGKVALPRYTLPALALWLVIILSLTVNSLLPSGFFEPMTGVVESFKYLAAVAWMIALYWLLSDRLPRRLLVFSSASVVVASWFAMWTVYDNLFLHEQRPTGPFENPNIYGNYLVLNVFLALGVAQLLANDQGRVTPRSGIPRAARTAALLVLVPVLTVGILATGSRGTLVGFLAGLAVAVRVPPPTAIGPRKLLAGIVGSIALLVAVVWFLQHHPYLLLRLGRTAGSDPNVEHRLALWRAALDASYSHPILGIGYGQFTSYAGYLRLWRAQVAHQTYLSVAAELGLVGLSVFVWLLWSVIRDSWRARPLAGRRLGKVCCGFVVATSVQGFFNNVEQFRSLWIMFGTIAALLVYGRVGQPRLGEARYSGGDLARQAGPARLR